MSMMKNVHPTVGLIGGTGWPSTITYFEQVPRLVQEKLGGLNTPDIVFQSRNFAKIDEWMHEGNWEAVTGLFAELTLQMKKSSDIDALAVLSNTLHKVAPEAAEIAGVPLIHIGECTAKVVQERDLKRIGFIGSKFTMQEDFVLEHFRERGIEVFVPPAAEMKAIDDIIFGELCQNKITGPNADKSRDFLFSQVARLIKRHKVEGIVLGCTELGLTMTNEQWTKYCGNHRSELRPVWGLVALPFIDATKCHIDAIVAYLCSCVR